MKRRLGVVMGGLVPAGLDGQRDLRLVKGMLCVRADGCNIDVNGWQTRAARCGGAAA